MMSSVSQQKLAELRNRQAADLLTYAFEQSSTTYDPRMPLYIDPICPSRNLSAWQTKVFTRRMVAGLQATGLRHGDCVFVHLFNSYLYPAVHFGIIGAGGVFFGSNPSQRSVELSRMLKLTTPSVIITSPELLPTIGRIAIDHGFQTDSIFVLDETTFSLSQAEAAHHEDSDSDLSRDVGSDDGSLFEVPGHLASCKQFLTLLEHGEADWMRIPDVETSKATVAALFSTSGTSGLPKVAPISHYALISQHRVLYYEQPYQVIRLATVPLFHLIGSLFTHLFPIRYGQPVYILRKFNPQDFIDSVKRHCITDTAVVPTILQNLRQFRKSTSLPAPVSVRSALRSLRYIFCAGSILDASSQNSFYELLSTDAVITQLYGMTEIGSITCFPYPYKDESGSVGRLLPGMELKLVNDCSNPYMESIRQSPGHCVGEAYVRGPGTSVMGYRHNPGDLGTESILDEDGWLATGDLMECIGDKYYIIGRVKEIMKIRGWQVSPTEVESLLLTHPSITDAAVKSILLPDSITEAIRAYVVVDDSDESLDRDHPGKGNESHGRNDREIESRSGNKKVTPAAIYDYARSRLASYKALDGGVVFVKEIPRTGSGKIVRWKLS